MRHAYDIRRDTTVEARYAREAMEARTLERLLNIYERNAARSGPLGDIREADVIRQVIMITSQAPRLSGAEETIYIENLTRLGQLATRGYAFSLRAHLPATWQARTPTDPSLQTLVRTWLEGGHFLQWGDPIPREGHDSVHLVWPYQRMQTVVPTAVRPARDCDAVVHLTLPPGTDVQADMHYLWGKFTVPGSGGDRWVWLDNPAGSGFAFLSQLEPLASDAETGS